MSSNRFIGRDVELAALTREFDRDRPSLVIVFGRRRVGKSTLLLEAIRHRPAVYYQAAQMATSQNIALFKRELSTHIGPDPVLDSLNDWSGLLAWIADAAREKELTIVLDEFPYLCESQPELPSLLQRFWDNIRRTSTRLNLVLCGSTLSFMGELLSERNPLHGRQTLELDIGPLSLRESAGFFPDWDAEEQTMAYCIFGGIPYYLELCDPEASIQENVIELVLARGAPLAREPNHILQAELTAISRYATLLRAIADGATTSGEIIGRVPEIQNSSQLAPYVQKLEALRLIRIVRSLDATERERDRRYFIDDPFLSFWYRFCLPHLSALEAGHAREVFRQQIAPHLDDYFGGIFEWVCRDHLRRYSQEILPAPAAETGQIWSADYDIDVAGTLLDGSVFYGECKWWKKPVGVNVLDRLGEVAGASRHGSGATIRHLLIFARRGFTPALTVKAASDPNLHLLVPEDMIGRRLKWHRIIPPVS